MATDTTPSPATTRATSSPEPRSVQAAAPGAPVGPVRTALERAAWGIPLSTRRLFVVLAITTAGLLVTSGVVAGWAATHNAATIRQARQSGLGLARAVTEFDTRLAAFDANAATIRLPGGLEEPPARPGYDPDLQDTGRSLAGYDPNLALAARALVDAGLVAAEDDREDLRILNDGLVRYIDLITTARANARQGNPVAGAYLDQARRIADDDLRPASVRLQEAGVRRTNRAANSVDEPAGLAAGLLAAALVVLVAASLVAAGRTRRATHPVLLAAALVVVTTLVIVAVSMWSQTRELRNAASAETDTYVSANQVASELSALRRTELEAVATQGSGRQHYETFRVNAAWLTERLTQGDLLDRLTQGTDRESFLQTIEDYVEEVHLVECLDLGKQAPDVSAVRDVECPELQERDIGEARRRTLEGTSAIHFVRADHQATSAVTRSAAALERSFDDASNGGVEPLQPVALSIIAAALAATGVLHRGRWYW